MGIPLREKHRRRIALFILLLLLVTAVGVAGWVLFQELSTSERQARWLHRYASKMTFAPEEGPAPGQLRDPPSGPYDRRLGYASLPVFTRNLIGRGFHISRQARVSDEMWDALQSGFFPPYREKTQAGLRILDRNGLLIFHHPYPTRVFRSFSDIPSLVVEMLLFVENRMLLDEQRPMMNPAVEWGRLAKAVTEKAVPVDSPGPVGQRGEHPGHPVGEIPPFRKRNHRFGRGKDQTDGLGLSSGLQGRGEHL